MNFLYEMNSQAKKQQKTMNSQTKISQSTLQSTHQSKLERGAKNDDKQNEIIDILEGVDHVLSIVLESNCKLSQLQLNKLYNIIAHSHKQQRKQTKIIINPSQNIEDNQDTQYDKSVTYELYDKHIILFALFNNQHANIILNILNSNVAKGTIFMMLIIGAILDLLQYNGLSINTYYMYATAMWLTITLYVLIWILYSNKHGINLLCKQFVFLFKVCYLILLVIASIWIEYVANNQPIYYVVAVYMAVTALLLLVMIFDAINVNQTNKILISTLALGLFSMVTVWLWQLEYYPDQYYMYHKAKITIHDHFGFGDIEISILSIASNSAVILTIFLSQQTSITIFYPKRSLVIRSKTFIKYKNKKETKPSANDLKLWRCMCICFNCVCLIYSVYNVMHDTAIILYIIWILITTIVLCLSLINTNKSIKISTIIFFVSCIINVMSVFVLNWHPIYLVDLDIIGAFIAFGLYSGYLLKIRQMAEYNVSKNSNIPSSVITKRNSLNNSVYIVNDKNLIDDQKIEGKSSDNDIQLNEIEVRNVEIENKWSNIERIESIEPTKSTAL
eukprot:316015_1